jgi:hypothetical protein
MGLFVCLTVSAMLLMACETPEDCEVTYGERVPMDTLFFGKWEYKFTISRLTLWEFEPPIVADDTIFIGETRSWMPEGHVQSAFFLSIDRVELLRIQGISGSTCNYFWYSDYFKDNATEDSLLGLAIGDFHEGSINGNSKTLYFEGFVHNSSLIRIWQDPFVQYSVLDPSSSTDTYDFYERVE